MKQKEKLLTLFSVYRKWPLLNRSCNDSTKLATYRSSPPEVFFGKIVLKIYSKCTGEHPYRSAISIKLLWWAGSELNRLRPAGVVKQYSAEVFLEIGWKVLKERLPKLQAFSPNFLVRKFSVNGYFLEIFGRFAQKSAKNEYLFTKSLVFVYGNLTRRFGGKTCSLHGEILLNTSERLAAFALLIDYL